jgi:hypothetical protein
MYCATRQRSSCWDTQLPSLATRCGRSKGTQLQASTEKPDQFEAGEENPIRGLFWISPAFWARVGCSGRPRPASRVAPTWSLGVPAWVSAIAPSTGYRDTGADLKTRRAGLSGHGVDPEIINPLPELKLRCQPAWGLPTARPGLRGLVGIAKFWGDRGIRPAPARRDGLPMTLGQKPQPRLEQVFLGGYLCRESDSDFFAQHPKFVSRQ